jgi:hypothetical protein
MKFTTDFTTISAKARIDIMDAIRRDLNADTILICRLSNHPDDHYLYLYIAQARDGYITGLANTSRDYGVGLYENHYNCTLKQAMEIMADKIKDCNKEEI